MSKQYVKIKSDEFQPKSEYVLIIPDTLEKEKTTESGIVLSVEQNSFDRPTYGEVQAVGSVITDLVPGQMVLWPNTDGLDLEFTDGHRILLRYKSIIGMKKA